MKKSNENSLGHLTDKQAEVTCNTNDFLSDAEIDVENDLDSFVMEKKLRSSGADELIA